MAAERGMARSKQQQKWAASDQQATSGGQGPVGNHQRTGRAGAARASCRIGLWLRSGRDGVVNGQWLARRAGIEAGTARDTISIIRAVSAPVLGDEEAVRES